MKIGILGLGSIGKRHFENFKKLGCEVRGYDPGVDGYDRHQVTEWANALVIASPTSNHYEDIVTCPAGIPLLVEKPIVDTVIRRNNICDDNHSIAMVGYNLRFHSCVIQARKWLGEGLIGKPLWANFTCAQYNDKPAYRRDGVILNWSHEIDLAVYLLGQGVICASSISNASESLADIIFEHSLTGCRTSIHLDYLTYVERRGFSIIGQEGTIDVNLVERTALAVPGNYPDIFFQGKDDFASNYLAEAQAFWNRIDGQETIGCTAKEALEVVDICLTAKEMAHGK